jgi:hypothetical protein
MFTLFAAVAYNSGALSIDESGTYAVILILIIVRTSYPTSTSVPCCLPPVASPYAYASKVLLSDLHIRLFDVILQMFCVMLSGIVIYFELQRRLTRNSVARAIG